MLLQELLGVKSLKNKSAGEILKSIKAENGITMHRGVYGIVLTHPKWNYVLKLFPKDDCYMDFLKFCKSHSSPHLPKIVKGPLELTPFFKDKKGNDVSKMIDKYYAVKLEKLAPFPDERGTELDNTVMMLCLHPSLRKDYTTAADGKAKDKVLKDYDKAFAEAGKKTNLKKHKSFFELLLKVHDNLDGSKCRPDLHPGNIMMRGNTLVIVDPYSALEKTGMSMLKIISKMDLDALTS